jgi:hypothetical protein
MPKVEVFSPCERFAALVADRSTRPDVSVSTKTGFGEGGLMVERKRFALLRGEELLLKLPATTAARLIAEGDAFPFDAGKGRPTRAWAFVGPGSGAKWTVLAVAARKFGSGVKVTDGKV